VPWSEGEITSAAILTYVLQHLWPLVELGDEFECLPPSWVSGNAGVMVLSDDLVMEFSILGYVDPVSEMN
jgi:hypothetical protein